jgi:hypothetical protein
MARVPPWWVVARPGAAFQVGQAQGDDQLTRQAGLVR